MTLSNGEARAIRNLVSLPEDDWQPEHWATYESSMVDLRAALSRWERNQGRRRPPREPHALQKARKVVVARSGGFCEAHTPDCPPGQHQAVHVHHKRGRNTAADHAPGRLLHVCREAHDFIHAHPELSYERGWLEHRLGAS